MVQVSTDEVYGSVASGPWTEDTVLAPNSPYAAAKAGGDLMVRAYAQTHGLDVSITRCCNNYGPYQYPNTWMTTAAAFSLCSSVANEAVSTTSTAMSS